MAGARCTLNELHFGAVSTEMIEDTLLHLAQENEQMVQAAAEWTGSFRESRIVEFVFLLCEQWGLEKSVSYQAVEILERSTVKQVEAVCRPAVVPGASEKADAQGWRTLTAQLSGRFLLRLMSCVQLASKLSFHYKIVSNVTILNFLQDLGSPYSKEELLESELAVLKALNFQVNLPTPLAYVETLLEVLGYNGCLVPTNQLHRTCVTLLDMVYLLHGPIYDSLLRASIENSTPSQLQGAKFVSVKEDFMLLAVGIIAASTFVHAQEGWSQVLGHLHGITGISPESIAEFSYTILTHTVGTSTPEKPRRQRGGGGCRHGNPLPLT
ncbi:cyclin N-terminal domain-containing protein 1 [Tachyglossus aculeatus]|uniref:cyclin N-terminal domain-containing protein 1 n=1 Tax=Tachyglossus aculeatus TaxID=9261 RepID=UPI0018F4BF9C|nr:cyclin N-terminal domain-containing protein 1 [Tachyglossus aculeatus]